MVGVDERERGRGRGEGGKVEVRGEESLGGWHCGIHLDEGSFIEGGFSEG